MALKKKEKEILRDLIDEKIVSVKKTLMESFVGLENESFTKKINEYLDDLNEIKKKLEK